MNDSINTNQLLVQLRSMAQDAGIPPSESMSAEVRPAIDGVDFSKILENSMQAVNVRTM